MPLVQITVQEGLPAEALEAICEGVHRALVSEANVPDDDRFQLVTQVPPGQLIAHPTYGGVQRSESLLVIQITLNRGRSVEVKKTLYAAIARNLEAAAGIRPDDVLVSLTEVSKEDWSFGGGRMTYEGKG